MQHLPSSFSTCLLDCKPLEEWFTEHKHLPRQPSISRRFNKRKRGKKSMQKPRKQKDSTRRKRRTSRSFGTVCPSEPPSPPPGPRRTNLKNIFGIKHPSRLRAIQETISEVNRHSYLHYLASLTISSASSSPPAWKDPSRSGRSSAGLKTEESGRFESRMQS